MLTNCCVQLIIYLPLDFKTIHVMTTQQRQVIHLYLKKEDEHHYFGSVPALFQHFTTEQLGIGLQSLYNVWRDEPYENGRIKLLKGRLLTTKRKMRES